MLKEQSVFKMAISPRFTVLNIYSNSETQNLLLKLYNLEQFKFV